MFHQASIRRLAVAAAVLLLVLPSRALLAQGGTITGKVTDAATQAPVPGAQVVVPGTLIATRTNDAGEYRLVNVQAGTVAIRANRLGYKATTESVRLAAGESLTHNMQLTASLVTLSELVVTGTAGNQERRAQSAVVASISADDIIKDAPISNVGELLQSRIPSVAINANSGTAGTAKVIRIRGASSVILSNQPLLFIDGVRVNEQTQGGGFASGGQRYDRLNDLSPDEIESIEVVKGPAAATLYGADASAGVIQVITKKGHAGSNKFVQTVRVEAGNIDQNWTPPDNYAKCTASTVASTSTNPLCRGLAVGALVHDNPLLRTHAFRTGTSRQFAWNGRGGGQDYGYYLSFSTDNTLGTLPNSQFERYNFRTNFNYVQSPKLTIEAGLGLVQTGVQIPSNDNSSFGWIGGALLGNPLSLSDAPNAEAGNNGWFNRQHYNGKAVQDNKLLTHRVTTNITANYLPVSWFTNRVTVGMDYAQDEQANFSPKNDSLWFGGINDGGNNIQGRTDAERYTVDYLGNLRRTFGKADQIEANLSFGLQVISSRNVNVNANGIGYVTNANNSIDAAASNTGGGNFTEQRQYGYLTQLQLGYENRMFVQFGVRVDKNSSFGLKSPSFILPKIGATWTVSEEKWFHPFANVFNTLRVRAAWGTTGRSPAPGDALTTLAARPYNIVGVTNAGAIPGNPGNANLKPERGTEYEAGMDASFWHDRVTTELSYFHKTTNDLIIRKPIPPSLGFATNPLANLGSVLNSGFELGLNIRAIEKKNFSWDIRAGGSTLHNELTSLGGLAPFGVGQGGRILVGQQLGVWVSKQIQSIDVANNKVIVNDTLTPVGNLLPTLEWNLTNTVTLFKNFRFTALLDSKRDFLVQNFTDYFLETQIVRSNKRLDPTVLSPYERLRRYGDQTPGNPAFVTVTGKNETVSNVTDAYLQPGDFVRLREVSATYTLPSTMLKSLRGLIQSASVSVAMQNVKLWTNYGGPDPEVISDGGAFSRFDFLTLPNPKTTVVRVNFTF